MHLPEDTVDQSAALSSNNCSVAALPDFLALSCARVKQHPLSSRLWHCTSGTLWLTGHDETAIMQSSSRTTAASTNVHVVVVCSPQAGMPFMC